MKRLIISSVLVAFISISSFAASLSFKGSEKDFSFWNYVEIYQFNKLVLSSNIDKETSINIEADKDYKIVFHSVFNDFVTKTFTSKLGGVKMKIPGYKYYHIHKGGSFFDQIKEGEKLNIYIILCKTEPGQSKTMDASIYYEDGDLKIAYLNNFVKEESVFVEVKTLNSNQLTKFKEIESGKYFSDLAMCTWYFELNNEIQICPIQHCLDLQQVITE